AERRLAVAQPADVHGSAGHNQVGGRGLQQLSGDPHDLLANLARGPERGGQRHRRATAGEATDTERHARTVAVDHRVPLGRDIQLVRHDLGQRRVDALTDGADTGIDHAVAGPVDLDARIFPRPEPGLLDEAADADTDEAALAASLGLLLARVLITERTERVVQR